MRFISEIKEGESFKGTLIGYKWMEYRSLDGQPIRALRLSFDLRFILVKLEFIPYEKA